MDIGIGDMTGGIENRVSIPWEMENRVDYLVKIEWSTPWKQNGVLHGNRVD